MKNDFIELDIKKIFPNPQQPRKIFENIEELASTIKYNGLINPITVVKSDSDKYMIVSGERRYKACIINKFKTIKCNVVDVDEFQLQELALIENIQRDDLTDFEKAKYIGLMWSTGRYEKKQDLATALGKSNSYISKSFSCLKLDESIINDLENFSNDVPLSVLDDISKIKDKDSQKEVYSKYLKNEITRDDIRELKVNLDENFAREKTKNINVNSQPISYDQHTINEIEDLKTRIKYLELENEQLKQNIILDSKISYGYGLQNSFGTFISFTKGDFLGSLQVETNTDIVNTSGDVNYQIIIKKVDIPKEELKEIKHMEIFDHNVYIEFTDNDCDTLSFNKATNLIKTLKQNSIPYELHGHSEKSSNFINKMPNRTQVNGKLVLKQKGSKK